MTRSWRKGTAQQASDLQLVCCKPEVVVCEFFAQWLHSASLLNSRVNAIHQSKSVLTRVILTILWNNLEMQPKRPVKQWPLDLFFGSLPYDVTLQVSDMALVSLLHGFVRPNVWCAVPLLLDLGSVTLIFAKMLVMTSMEGGKFSLDLFLRCWSPWYLKKDKSYFIYTNCFNLTSH